MLSSFYRLSFQRAFCDSVDIEGPELENCRTAVMHRTSSEDGRRRFEQSRSFNDLYRIFESPVPKGRALRRWRRRLINLQQRSVSASNESSHLNTTKQHRVLNYKISDQFTRSNLINFSWKLSSSLFLKRQSPTGPLDMWYIGYA